MRKGDRWFGRAAGRSVANSRFVYARLFLFLVVNEHTYGCRVPVSEQRAERKKVSSPGVASIQKKKNVLDGCVSVGFFSLPRHTPLVVSFQQKVE